MLDPTTTYLIVAGVVATVMLGGLIGRYVKNRKVYKLTKPGLVERAEDTANDLSDFANTREASRRPSEVVLAGGSDNLQDHPDRYVHLYDEGTRVIYRRDYLPEIKLLRDEFAKRGVREKSLDGVCGDPEGVADMRTISTALLVMARRLD